MTSVDGVSMNDNYISRIRSHDFNYFTSSVIFGANMTTKPSIVSWRYGVRKRPEITFKIKEKTGEWN